MNTSKDVSEKIDPQLAEVVTALDAVSRKLSIPFLIVGAAARDIYFSTMHGIPTKRATLDVDFAIRVKNWEEFERFAEELTASGAFRRNKTHLHRFSFHDGLLIDIVPFGGIENPVGTIVWQGVSGRTMSVIGFDEAFRFAETVRISTDPLVDIKLCTPAGLVLTKLISWREGYPQRNRDAVDIHFIMVNYLELGHDSRLYNTDADIVEERNFDYDLAGPRILGRDIAKISNPETFSIVRDILEEETNDASRYRLALDMIRGSFSDPQNLDGTINLLKSLMRGMVELPP